MGRMCCVPGCTSNYHTNKEGYISTFIFPSDKERREKWIRAIPRADFVPGKRASVCAKHFPESDIVRVDSIKRSDGSVLTLPRQYPKLTNGACPTIFCEQTYLSQSTSANQHSPQERRKQILQKDELNPKVQCEEDKILVIQDLVGVAMEDRNNDKADSKLEVKEESWWQVNNPSPCDSTSLLEKEPNKTKIKEEAVWLKSEWENIPASSPCPAVKNNVKTEVKEEPLWSKAEIEIKDNKTVITGMDDASAARSPRLNTETVSNDGTPTSGKESSSDCKAERSKQLSNVKQKCRNEDSRESSTLSSNLRKHKGKKRLTCDICNKSFKYSSYLKIHKERHEATRLHQCNICEKRFKVANDLRKHYSTIHEDVKLHKCEVCQKNFNVLANLKRHYAVHENIRPHKCEMCQKTFKLLQQLKRHYLTHDKPNKCEICQNNLRTACFKKHCWIHEKRPHKCDICQKSFKLLSRLKIHVLIHENRGRHKCDFCHMSFKFLSHLKRHSNIHVQKRLFTCHVCQRSFRSLSVLKTHILIHQNSEPFKCKICQMNFKFFSALKTHCLIQEGKRPYKCHICQKSFRLLLHVKTHSLIHAENETS